MQSQSKRPAWIGWAAVFLGWTALGLLLTLQAWVFNENSAQPFYWGRNAIYRLTPQWVWAALTPFMAGVARRVTLDAGRRRREILALFGLSLVLAPLHRMASIALHYAIVTSTGILPLPFGRAMARSRLAILGGSLDSWIMFWTILVVLFALRYYERMRSEQLRASRLEAQLAQSQLQALRMQLQPHFLFNTLHTIASLVDEDVVMARRMIARFGELLRSSLDETVQQEVPLGQELQSAERYLAIETIRFQNRLGVEIDVPDEVRDATVPSFLLQPLVENAVRHGIAPRSDPGKLWIRAVRNDGRLRITIEDDGVGATRPPRPGGGVGLRNLRSRLEQLYGTGASLDAEAGAEGGFKVCVELPFRRAAPVGATATNEAES